MRSICVALLCERNLVRGRVVAPEPLPALHPRLKQIRNLLRRAREVSQRAGAGVPRAARGDSGLLASSAGSRSRPNANALEKVVRVGSPVFGSLKGAHAIDRTACRPASSRRVLPEDRLIRTPEMLPSGSISPQTTTLPSMRLRVCRGCLGHEARWPYAGERRE